MSEEIKQTRSKKKLEKTNVKIQESLRKKKIEKLGKLGKQNYLDAAKVRETKLRENKNKTMDVILRERMNKLRKTTAKKTSEKLAKERKMEDIRCGKIRKYKLKTSKHNMPDTKTNEFVMPSELPANLKNTACKISDIARDRFDSVYRRGLIEYKPIGKAQRNSKYKVHSTLRVGDVFYMEDK